MAHYHAQRTEIRFTGKDTVKFSRMASGWIQSLSQIIEVEECDCGLNKVEIGIACSKDYDISSCDSTLFFLCRDEETEEKLARALFYVHNNDGEFMEVDGEDLSTYLASSRICRREISLVREAGLSNLQSGVVFISVIRPEWVNAETDTCIILDQIEGIVGDEVLCLCSVVIVSNSKTTEVLYFWSEDCKS